MSVTAVVGCQWGDEGKGKVVDFLSLDADIVARYQGGPNAGHTVVVNGEQTILHQIPAGILHPEVLCCLGNGCVIDPQVLLREIGELTAHGVEIGERLQISHHAHLIMPYHRVLDEAYENTAGQRKIGTTGRGIGPAYTDKYNRCGIRIVDLFRDDGWENVICENIDNKNRILSSLYKKAPLNAGRIVEEYRVFRKQLRPYVHDVSLTLSEAIRAGKRIILEGAQGALLDVDHGTYPFVTSSNPTAGMAATGVGIGPRQIDQVLGVLKAYTTRVGNGPFPTEITAELQSYFRDWGSEYGATTGRSRRCGWLDLVVARFAARINSVDSWVITKLDVLSRLDQINVCTAYQHRDRQLQHFPPEPWILDEVKPVYEALSGWKEDISGIRDYRQLPPKCREYLDFIADHTGVSIDSVSVGADRGAIIRLRLRR